MNQKLYREQFSGELKAYLETKSGIGLFQALSSMCPPYEFPKEEHLLAENRGARRGYEMCLKNIIALCSPPQVESIVEANYGITPSREDNPKP